MSTETVSEHPWPHLAPLFNFKATKANSVVMKCNLCLPKPVEICAFMNSSSNLRKHVERMHPSKIKDYDDCIGKRSRKSESLPSTSSSKQARIDDTVSVPGGYRVSQAKVDELVIGFICEGLQPFSVVELPAFQELVTTLHPDAAVISRPTVRSRIQEAAAHVRRAITARLSKVEFVSTTTDCWTARQRSYVGVTAHWLDEKTFGRRSAALACKRLQGLHTFQALAAALDDVHSQYRIRDKVMRTTTDSGSNFLKTFGVFGEQSDSKVTAADPEVEESGHEEEEEVGGVEYLEACAILENDTGLEYQLPKHQRCACHLLNLVATADADKAETQNRTYRKLSRSAFGKCQGMWGATARSATAAEVVDAECRLPFIRPNQARWSSVYLAVKKLNRIVQQQGEEAIRKVCAACQVNMLNPAEFAFLSEYAAAMKPVALALNVLQSESNTHMGYVLPTLHQLKSRLRRLEASGKACLPLLQALQEGVQKRFGEMMVDPELIAAAILLPRFKTAWTAGDDGDVIEAGSHYIRRHLASLPANEREPQRSNSSDEEDFFSSVKHSKPDAADELHGYLASRSSDISLLNAFPCIKKLSLQLNTGLPASAACQRLFGCAGPLFTAKPAAVDCADFENQLLLKLNSGCKKEGVF